MITSLGVLLKVGVVCGVGFLVATGYEWFSDLEVKPKSKTIQVGQEKKKVVNDNDSEIEHLRKKSRQAG